MKKVVLILFAAFLVSSSFAQILNPVKFNYSVVKKGKDTYEVHIKTILDPKWHIYSVNNPEGGAEATEVKVKEGTAIGKTKEIGTMKTVYEKEFKVDQKFYETTVDFIQVVKVKPGTKNISGSISYMVCNDSRCLPPKEVEFKIKI
jgi:hypothetical protein